MSNVISLQAVRAKLNAAKKDFKNDYVDMLHAMYHDTYTEFEVHALIETYQDGTERVIDYVAHGGLDGNFADVDQMRKELETYVPVHGRLSIRTFKFPVR